MNVHTATLLALVAAAGATLSVSTGAVQPATRVVYASAFDKNGSAVKDMSAVEFEVKEGGKTREIVSAEPAKIPLRIALLVADQGTGAFQRGLGLFMQKLLGRAEFALTSVIVQPEKVIDYSHDGRELSEALSRLGPRGRQQGGQLMEAILEATKGVRHEQRRPVIVVMRLGGEGPTVLSGPDVLEELRKSGAALYVVAAAGSHAAAPPQATGTDPVSVAQGRLRDSELSESASNLGQVLDDGAKDSGGRYEQVIATTHARAMEQVAEELLNQYEIRYVTADGTKPNAKLSVSSKRKGITVRAPSRIPM
jgi:hypothetical protein